MPEISATIRVVDAFSNPLDKLANGLSRAQSGFSRLKGALGGNMFGGAEKSSRGLFKSMFYVINHTTVPAILVEIGFISNDNERNELITDKRKQATAKAITDGIIEYLKGRK